MNQIVWGGLSALSWGTADFMAGISGRRLGFATTLFWVFVVSAICMTCYLAWGGHEMRVDPVAQWRVVLFGLMNTVAMLLLYRALSLGPISLAAPVVAAHPAFVVLFAFALGSRPDLAQWLGMGLAVAGAIVVARAVREPPDNANEGTNASANNSANESAPRARHRRTIIVSSAACIAYTAMIISGQHAVPLHGDLFTVWLGRTVALIAIVPFLFFTRASPFMPVRWWPFVAAQGTFDFLGMVFLLRGSHGDLTEITAVISSLFGAVTVLLARFILRESMSRVQWGGIAMVFAGVALLSGHLTP